MVVGRIIISQNFEFEDLENIYQGLMTNFTMILKSYYRSRQRINYLQTKSALNRWKKWFPEKVAKMQN